ncbi:GTPase IMAP family member 8-like isoform X2 [Onychostoma macrolepis]|uniref:GTPase IMAP family member 8-like isoform X2 n=1 Tax=Onychostoma macrolepis TaxID=369639 RepID=UPI00272A8026|nr:GTPase IMAP family member 8-like isoform X2 [Onychostoma macrolepis]
MASEYEGNSQDLRIVLLGVSGAGKSSIGNTILGREAFKESRTRESEIQRGRVEDRNISIMDTPGFFNTHLTDEELQEQMMKSLDLSDPGPHVFLLVINLETFEKDERNIFAEIEEIFGVQAFNFVMVLFIGREQMTGKKWKKWKLSEKFQDLVCKCREQYHVINHKNEVIQTQIKHLLKKIHEFIKQNDEQHFDNKIETKEKKKQEENCRKKEQEKGRQEQAMQETFEMNRAMEEGATLSEPEEFQLRKKTTHVYEETVLQGMNSLDRSLTFSHERMGEENEVKKQENSLKTSQKKQQTTEEKHSSQAGRVQYLAACFGLICVLSLVFIMFHHGLKDYYTDVTTEKDQSYQFSKSQGVTHSDDVRIVLLGKTGVGKSSTGNTILGREAFKSLMSSRSVTRESLKETSEFNRRQITVVDTPGLFDTGVDNVETKKEIEKCVSMVVPGPHVFLLVIPLRPFTQEEKDTVKMIQKMFGDQSRKYTMVLFTRGDDLRGTTIEQFIEENDSLQYLIQQCEKRYHVFNNKETEDQTQVSELLEKIDRMVAANGGRFYTNEMFQQAEKDIREERERILKEKEEEIKRIKSEIKQIEKEHEREKQEIQNEQKKREEEFRKREEEIKKETDDNVRTEMQRILEEQKNLHEEENKRKEKYLAEQQAEIQNLEKRLEEQEVRRMSPIVYVGGFLLLLLLSCFCVNNRQDK